MTQKIKEFPKKADLLINYNFLNHQYILNLIFFLITLLVLICFAVYFADLYLMNIVDTQQLKTNVLHLNAGIVIILTALIVCAGWLQFTNLNQTSKGDFLLRIDTRYSSDEILKARTLIHKFYCQTKDENITDDRHVELIGNKILEIKYKESEAENFIILINFLDFLETIAFFVRKDYVSPKEVHELIGGSTVYYFKVFKPWIFHRRLKRNNNNYYCEIEKLISQLEG